MTGTVVTHEPEGDVAAPASLADRVREARARLDPPPAVTVPAPRSAGGVMAPAGPDTGADTPGEDLVAAVDRLAEELAAVEADREDEVHRTLCRIAGLVRDGVPEAGWSADEGPDVDVLRATAEAARGLHGRVTSLVERLDGEERPGAAVVVDSVATTLRVVGVVADLEVMERARRSAM